MEIKRFEKGKFYAVAGRPVAYQVEDRTSEQVIVLGPLGGRKRLTITVVDGVEMIAPIAGSPGVILRAENEVEQ